MKEKLEPLYLSREVPRIGSPDLVAGAKRTCNRHNDCDEANKRAREKGFLSADHCHDEDCEDCFGS